MIATIILGIFSVLFAYLTKYKHGQWGLKASFTLIFLFLALRYDFGNDYKTYLNSFIAMNWNQSLENNLYFWILQFEPGWLFLNWLFGSLGFFALTAVLALINCIIYYCFIKKYLSAQYYWIAVFIYIFNPVFMLTHVSAMRQSIAIMLFVFSLDYLYQKSAIRFFFCIVLASLFHISAIVLFPLYFLGLSNWRVAKKTGVIIFSIFVSLFLFGQAISPYFKKIIASVSDRYVDYQVIGEFSSGLGVIYVSGCLLLTLYFERSQNKKTALLFKIAIISYLLMPLNLIFDLSGRLVMYFTIATIIVCPIILINLKKPLYKYSYLSIIIMFTIYKFFQHFNEEFNKDHYSIYHTIFSAPQWN